MVDLEQVETVITVKNISKTFHIKEQSAMTIRSRVLSTFLGKRQNTNIVKALQNINFSIKKGEFFGIIGHNGSGKSTLLNILMGSIRPDKGGIIETKGRMIRLALGMGFDPNLTARDNIYLNGSILGLTFRQIGSVFHEIIGFAELEKFVDVPVKMYSRGMMTKLKFSIALYAEADIFLMDEFFGGVGDISFRKKSEAVFKERLVEGRTIIHVSHSLPTITAHCDRVLLLDKGIPIVLGEPKEVVEVYKKIMNKR